MTAEAPRETGSRRRGAPRARRALAPGSAEPDEEPRDDGGLHLAPGSQCLVGVRPAAHHTALASAIRSLSAEKSPGCLLDAQGTFLFVNEAWERHASQNGGAPQCLGETLIGTRWLDHIQGEEVRERYAALLGRALAAPGPRPRPVTQVSECNTPVTAALLSTRLDPVLEAGEAVGVRMVHAVVRTRPIDEVYEVVHRPVERYRDAEGRLTQCSCCRRLRDPSEPEQWDLVPEVMAQPEPATQALCAYCAELHVGPEGAG